MSVVRSSGWYFGCTICGDEIRVEGPAFFPMAIVAAQHFGPWLTVSGPYATETGAEEAIDRWLAGDGREDDEATGDEEPDHEDGDDSRGYRVELRELAWSPGSAFAVD